MSVIKYNNKSNKMASVNIHKLHCENFNDMSIYLTDSGSYQRV
jgi:hypothetical protein